MEIFCLSKATTGCLKMYWGDVAMQHLASVLHCQLVSEEIFKGLGQQLWLLFFSEWWNGFIVYISVLSSLWATVCLPHTAAFSLPLSGRCSKAGSVVGSWNFMFILQNAHRNSCYLVSSWAKYIFRNYSIAIGCLQPSKVAESWQSIKIGLEFNTQSFAGLFLKDVPESWPMRWYVFDVKLLEQEVFNS